MKRFARIAVPLGAALVALVLAIAASATTSKTEQAQKPREGSAGGSTPGGHELPRVHPRHAGKANPKLSKVYIGWVNQQGGQVVIGGLATAGASLAVKYVNDHSAALAVIPSSSCRASSSPLRKKARPAGRSSSTTSGSAWSRRVQSPRAPSRSTRHRRHEADRHRRRHHPGQRSIEDRRRPLRRRPAHPPAVRELREERPPCEDRRGRLPERAGCRGVGTGDRGRPEGCRHRDQAGRLHAGPVRPDRPAARSRSGDGGLHRPLRLGVRLREPGEGAQAAGHHRLEEDRDGAALPQLRR